MTDTQSMVRKPDVKKLSNELTYRRYLMSRGKDNRIFRKITIPEYIALYFISSENTASGGAPEKVYLKTLAERMQLEMYQVSKMAGELKDRGLIVWSHDGNGSQGTYVIITETGQKLLHEQEEILKEYYGRVIEQFGEENLIDLLQKMRHLENVMREVAEKEC